MPNAATSKSGTIAQDALSGFLVFLIALPLCLGISVASGFPPIAGVFTAIVGGILITHWGSAALTIKGPAAGLIVITLGAVTELGMGDPIAGYHRALAVGVVAAVLQIIFAVVRAGGLAAIMPPTIVHGMLAAIGVIIIAKQVPVTVGFQGAGGEPFEMIMEIPHYITHSNPEIFLIGGLSLLLLVLFPLIPIKLFKKIPPPLVVVLTAIAFTLYFDLTHEHDYTFSHESFHVGPNLLVRLPGHIWEAIALPDFSMILTPVSLKYIVMFALVGTIESLLSVLAVDSMDPEKRVSNLNRDLLVTGIGNLVCACLGGLPMISEIVRSKANIDAGAKSRWSNFFHGLSLLLFVALLPNVLQLIPLAALAAMLVVTGSRLASPKEFKHAYDLGKDQFALFLTTFIVTLATDLLIGVGAGIALKIAIHLARGASLKDLFSTPLKATRDGNTLNIDLEGPVVFTNLLYLRQSFERNLNPDIEVVKLNFEKATLIDHTALSKIKSSAEEWPNAKLELIGLEGFQASSDHPEAARVAIAVGEGVHCND
ncbi:MAG: SulP family inorganic anion transporter [Planctomycetota bacterium]|nr:SulP family inorganic anion transporter [Planctomycetota bacterium]